MRVDSEVGKGTRFDLYVPLEELVEDIAESDDLHELEGSAERVLVVVEEAGQLTLFTDTLDAYGYQAHPSQSGTAALQWMEAGGLPDLVVLDADMNLLTGVRTLAALIEQGYGGGVHSVVPSGCSAGSARAAAARTPLRGRQAAGHAHICCAMLAQGRRCDGQRARIAAD